jgi:hypothetical protein
MAQGRMAVFYGHGDGPSDFIRARRILAVITLCSHTEVVYLGIASMRFYEVKIQKHLLPVIWTSCSVVLFIKTRNLAYCIATIRY